MVVDVIETRQDDDPPQKRIQRFFFQRKRSTLTLKNWREMFEISSSTWCQSHQTFSSSLTEGMISESVCPLYFQYLKQYARGAPFNDQLLS
jgi:hypothetical protein